MDRSAVDDALCSARPMSAKVAASRKSKAETAVIPSFSEAGGMQRLCMRDRIRETLLSRILDSSYPAGMRLKELSLAREFKVSQAPIREALRELEAQGLVISERYRGTRVREIDLEELREAYELRATLEARSAEMAVPMVPEMLERIRQCLETMRGHCNRDERWQFTDAGLRLHRMLVEAGGNRTFLKVWDSLGWEVRSRLAAARLNPQGGKLQGSLERHQRLFERLEAADAPGAGRAAREVFATFLPLLTDSPSRTAT